MGLCVIVDYDFGGIVGGGRVGFDFDFVVVEWKWMVEWDEVVGFFCVYDFGENGGLEEWVFF